MNVNIRPLVKSTYQLVITNPGKLNVPSLISVFHQCLQKPILPLTKPSLKPINEGTKHPKGFATEAERVVDLMEQYQKLVKGERIDE